MARILIIEDHDDLRLLLVELFASEGYDVAECRDGARALSLLAEPDAPECVVLDLNLPIIDGEIVLRAIRNRPDPRVPVVVSSANPQAAKVGGDAFVPKPFEVNQLLAAVRKVMQEPPGRPPAAR